jgi:hypothetical protein
VATQLAGVREVHGGQSIDRSFSVNKSSRRLLFCGPVVRPGVKSRALFAATVTALALGACEDARKSAASAPTSSDGRAPSPPQASTERPESPPLLSLSTSAYQASLAVDDDAAYLLTSHAAYRLAPGRPADALKVELGFGGTATRHGLVYWSDGAVREASKQGGESRRLGTLAARPQLFISSGDVVAWLERSEDGRFSLGSLATERPSTIYASPGTIDAATMIGDLSFFVERTTDAEWRIGAVRTKGGRPVFTTARRGRSPAMLVGHHDIYYYDGNVREVRRLSPDLRREDTLVSDFICSPLAVAERVYCANVEGIFELAPQGPRRLVKLGRDGTVTDLAANARRLFWIADAGADRLVVETLALGD